MVFGSVGYMDFGEIILLPREWYRRLLDKNMESKFNQVQKKIFFYTLRFCSNYNFVVARIKTIFM